MSGVHVDLAAVRAMLDTGPVDQAARRQLWLHSTCGGSNTRAWRRSRSGSFASLSGLTGGSYTHRSVRGDSRSGSPLVSSPPEHSPPPSPSPGAGSAVAMTGPSSSPPPPDVGTPSPRSRRGSLVSAAAAGVDAGSPPSTPTSAARRARTGSTSSLPLRPRADSVASAQRHEAAAQRVWSPTARGHLHSIAERVGSVAVTAGYSSGASLSGQSLEKVLLVLASERWDCPCVSSSVLVAYLTAIIGTVLSPLDTWAVVRSLLKRGEDSLSVPFTADPNTMRLFMHTVDDLLITGAPGTVAHLSTIGTHSSLVFGQIITRCWVGVMPWDVVLRIVDHMLFDGLYTLCRVSVHIIGACEPLVLQCRSAEEVLHTMARKAARAVELYEAAPVDEAGRVPDIDAVVDGADDGGAAPTVYARLFARSPRMWQLMHQLFIKNSLVQLILCRGVPDSMQNDAGDRALQLSPSSDLQPPFSLVNYHWIGFDLDHTLIDYISAPVNRHMFKAVVAHLRASVSSKRGELASLLHADNPYWEEFAATSIVLDKLNGNVLFVDEDGRAMRGFHGQQQLQGVELEALYGLGAIADKAHASHFSTVNTEFDVGIGPLFALLVSRRDVNPECAITYADIAEGLVEAFRYVYTRFCTDGFEVVLASPAKFVRKQKAVRKWLQALRRPIGWHRVRLFALTNASYAHAAPLMSYAFGDDWVDLFDLVVVSAKKKRFLTNSDASSKRRLTEALFSPVDLHTKRVVTSGARSRTVHGIDLKKHKVYSGGRVEALMLFFREEQVLRNPVTRAREAAAQRRRLPSMAKDNNMIAAQTLRTQREQANGSFRKARMPAPPVGHTADWAQGGGEGGGSTAAPALPAGAGVGAGVGAGASSTGAGASSVGAGAGAGASSAGAGASSTGAGASSTGAGALGTGALGTGASSTGASSADASSAGASDAVSLGGDHTPRIPPPIADHLASTVVRVCYFGDHVLQDVVLSNRCGWDAVAVLPPLRSMMAFATAPVLHPDHATLPGGNRVHPAPTRRRAPSAAGASRCPSPAEVAELNRLYFGTGWGHSHMSLTTSQVLRHAVLSIPSVLWLAQHAPKLDSVVTPEVVCTACRLPRAVMDTVVSTPPPPSLWTRIVMWCQQTLRIGRRQPTVTPPPATPPRSPCRTDVVLHSGRPASNRRQRAMSAEAVRSAPPMGRVVLYPGHHAGASADAHGSWKWLSTSYCAELFGRLGVLPADVASFDSQRPVSDASWDGLDIGLSDVGAEADATPDAGVSAPPSEAPRPAAATVPPPVAASPPPTSRPPPVPTPELQSGSVS